jgi:two-component system, NtrC family, response regulator HydG
VTTAGTRVLIADDHIGMARLVAAHLGDLGCECVIVSSGSAAIEELAKVVPDVVISDLRMADVDGLDVLDAARAVDPDLPVILMTAFGAIEGAIEAMRRGASNYLTKPLRLEELKLHVQRALDDRRLRREIRTLRAAGRTGLDGLVGRSGGMRDLYGLIERVAPSAAPVLVRGESGTGKELVARAIHDSGPRRQRPFVAVNCTALPEPLLESELFGHARGAFTGASAPRAGLFAEASGGSLFLDEIGDMPPALQAKLLRVVQEGTVRPVGADESRSVDVRIISATHQDLEERIRAGEFRADLYYRLNVVPVHVPPLRDRPDDIPLLAEYFLQRARQRNPHSPVEELGPSLISELSRGLWPGNVRELENLIERLVVVGTTRVVDAADIPGRQATGDKFRFLDDELPTLRQLEDDYIAWILARCDGSKARAAAILGVDVTTIHRRLRGTS